MHAKVRLSKTADSPSPEYYAWEVAGAPARVNLRLDVASEIGRQLQRLHATRPENPLFGLLIGHVAPDRVVIIDGFEPADAGDDEEQQHKQALAKWAGKADPKPSVVGYCREQTGDGFSLSSEDMSLLRSRFWRLLSVVMLVKSSVAGVPEAGFFFAELGEPRSRFCLSRFPLDWTQLVGRGGAGTPAGVQTELPAAPFVLPIEPTFARNASAVAQPAPSEVKTGNDSVTATPAPKQSEASHSEPAAVTEAAERLVVRKSRRRLWRWAPAACAVGVLLAGVSYIRSAGHRQDSLTLSATRTPAGVEIRWDRNAPVFTAQGALLTIREGDFQKDLYLDLAQIRTGHVLYTPQSNEDLQLRMDVFAASEKAARQSVVIVRRGGPAPTVTEGEPGGDPGTPAQVADGSEVVVAPTELQLAAGSAATVEVTGVSLDPMLSPAKGAGDAATWAAAEPSPKPTFIKLEAGGATTEPRAISRVMPVIPPDARIWKGNGLEVAVRIKIDPAGNVIHAVVQDAKTPAANFLGRLAADAARQWRFEPARSGNRRVSSEMVLRFQF